MALGINERDVIYRYSDIAHDGTLVITLRVPADRELDADDIYALIEEGIKQEYGDDTDVQVDVAIVSDYQLEDSQGKDVESCIYVDDAEKEGESM